MRSLDAILGREQLKERIAELEDERERLEAQLEAEQSRRQDAVRARQSAEERVNALEDRVAGLEGELEERSGDAADPTWSRVEQLQVGAVGDILTLLESVETVPEGMLSAAVEDTLPEQLRAVLGETAALVERATPCLCYFDDHGTVRAVLAPPRPPEPFVAWAGTARIDRSWFLPEDRLTFALVRSDLFAFGRIDDATPTFGDGFESDVMGRHSKGGFSQSRFERRRSDQVDEHLEQCREVLEDVEGELILVGDRKAVGRLRDLASDAGTVDASGEPATAFQQAFREYWTTQLYIP